MGVVLVRYWRSRARACPAKGECRLSERIFLTLPVPLLPILGIMSLMH